MVTISHFGAARGGWRPTSEAETEAEAVSGSDVPGDLYISDNIFFKNVPESVWRYELGGYPVLKKWLGYRDARRRNNEPLTLKEKDHLREIVQRIAALLVLYPRLNSLYEQAAANAWTRREVGME